MVDGAVRLVSVVSDKVAHVNVGLQILVDLALQKSEVRIGFDGIFHSSPDSPLTNPRRRWAVAGASAKWRLKSGTTRCARRWLLGGSGVLPSSLPFAGGSA